MNWLTFVGEGRSGHTLLSGAIGSHPNARITEEAKWIDRSLRAENSVDMPVVVQELSDPEVPFEGVNVVGKARKKQGWEGLETFSDPLMLLGDKCGWDATNAYKRGRTPVTVIGDFGNLINMPVKTVITVRNPYDNIANWVLSNKYTRIFPDPGTRQNRMIRRYRRFYNAAADIVSVEGVNPFIVHHEKFLEDPRAMLESLCDYLELPVHDEWMAKCLEIVNAKPHRYEVKWRNHAIDGIEHVINTNPLMSYYRCQRGV